MDRTMLRHTALGVAILAAPVSLFAIHITGATGARRELLIQGDIYRGGE
jgi:hypothetical protein